ncbi:hypothetical protein N0Y54_09605 [Nostoc punctiforme UO1]|uniref:hypothetical protein n=1 Tax=Nostoc punctiforme TaxID=272131 RepID=UPI0030A4475C
MQLPKYLYKFSHSSGKAKILYQSQIFNVDAERLAAGYRRAAEEAERREKMLNPSVLGDRLLNLGSRLLNSGSCFLNSGSRLLNLDSRLLNSGDRLLNSGGRLLNSGSCLLNLDSRLLNSDSSQ